MSNVRYVVKGLPLQGGYGQVFPVKDTFLDRDVMYKSLKDGTTDGQLLNEVSALANVRSKHVVEIYDVIKAESGGVQAIVIEQLTGASYTDFHARSKGSVDLALRALYQVACALSDLHDAGIIHRDLKPENIKDSSEGVLKIFDFGIASTAAEYVTKENRGTIVYSAPELYKLNAKISKEMDIYSFGVCCWAFCHGYFPGELLTTPPVVTKCPSLAAGMGGVDPRIISILDACLDEDPAARPNAKQLKETLFSALTSGRHRGRFAYGGKHFDVTKVTPTVIVTITGKGKLSIKYDGFDFKITHVEGIVEVNGAVAVVGRALPAACVLTFGGQATGRSFVTFSSSHPEVVI